MPFLSPTVLPRVTEKYGVPSEAKGGFLNFEKL